MKKKINHLLVLGIISFASMAGAESCLDQAGPLAVISGTQSSQLFKTNYEASTKIDARTASWTSLINIPVKIGGGDGVCVSGATIKGMWDPFTTSWDTYHDTYAFVVYGKNMTVENLRVDNYGDAINIRNDVNTGQNFTVRGIHVTNNHDDCFQNDSMKAGEILDNLFDGCYNFYSSRGYYNSLAPDSGPTAVVRIENNLVRAQPFPTYYGGQAADLNDPSQYQNGGFFKIDEFDKAPKLAIHNNIFRVDKDSRGWVPLMPNALSIASCSNNIVVWLGEGSFPEKLPSCFTLTTDKSVWDNAVAKWKYEHGQGPNPNPDPTAEPDPTPEPDPVPAIDTIAPATALLSPSSGSSVLLGATVSMQASASDNVGVYSVRFYVNGSTACIDKIAPYSCSWKPKKRGIYKLHSRATDSAGNDGKSSIVYLTVK